MFPHSSKQTKKKSTVALTLLWIRIAFHVFRGVLTLCFLMPFSNPSQKVRKTQRWARRLLNILQVQLEVSGVELPKEAPFLLASNHISWLDIHAINAFRVLRFVAKSEVEDWPIFGWMAKQLDTIFIRRDSSRHARAVVEKMAQALSISPICIFPEGTSSIGDRVLPFKSNLFEAALVAKVPVFPMAIQYLNRHTGQRSIAPAFVGEMTLLESIHNIISSPDLAVSIEILPPYLPEFGVLVDRKQLTLFCQDAIGQAINQHDVI
jgi:1-acyl-sn-glycerol-3-phosphate acyltransferase